jgi:hypothetical protein
MAPSTFVDMVRVASASAGTGPLVLGPPVTAFQGTDALIDGHQYSYSIQQDADDAWEYGQGIWNASTATLARGVIKSSIGTSPIGLRAGTPISITVLAEDFAATDQAALAAAVASAQQSAADADADVALTAADRVATGQDRTAAGNSATAAAGSAGAAAASATAANTSAVAAAGSATTAAGAVAATAASATAAAGSATTASNAATTATNASSSAGTSATNAATSATAAAGSAISAGNSAASTAADRVQTGQDRTAAASSATAAGLSELNAGNSATAAAGSATTAQNRATDAANSAATATTKATEAFNSAVAAGGQASAAAGSATSAAGSLAAVVTSATNAANSATAAAGSATTATTQAGIATTQATSAAGSATTATTQAGIATSAATRPAWSTFASLTVPAPIILIQTADTLAAGSSTGTASALYKLDPEQTAYPAALQAYITASIALGTASATAYAAADTFMAFWRRQSANGRWFTLAEPEPWSGQFGCPGDGAVDSLNVATGTDVWANMQAFIDYCVYIQRCHGRIGPGLHILSRGLQHGYGNTFVGGSFTGAGQAYSGATNFPGTTLYCTTDEDPVLNISGARAILWEKLTFKGKYTKWMIDNTLGYMASPMVLDDLDPASWIASYYRTSQDGQYNPAALVTIDCYEGTKPVATAYANSIPYVVRRCIYANGNVYVCTVAGTSAATGGGPTGTSSAYVDGTATFRYLGPEDTSNRSLYVAYREPYRPAWLMNPASSSYGVLRAGSFVTIRDATFVGSPSGFVCKPCNSSSQGDFMALERCNFYNLRYCISFGNNQMRGFAATNCQFGIYDCLVTNNTHGQQSGSIKGGVISGCAAGSGVDLIRVDNSYAQPLIFIGMYTEVQRRIGLVSYNVTGVSGPMFIGPALGLAFIHATRGRYPAMLYSQMPNDTNTNFAAASTGSTGTVFTGGVINVDSVFTSFVEGTRFDGTHIYAYDRPSSGVANQYQAMFNNALGGGFVSPGLEYRHVTQNIIFYAFNIDTLSGVAVVNTGGGYKYSSRPWCIPAMVKSVRAFSGTNYESITVPHQDAIVVNKGSGNTLSFPNVSDPTELTMVFPGASQATNADLNGFGPGSVMMDGKTGTVWAVRSFDDTTDTLIAVAQNNYRTIAGVKSFVVPVTTNTGAICYRHARLYTPANPIFGDFTAASATIANVGSSTGVGTSIATDVVAGDYLMSPQQLDAVMPATSKVVTPTNGSPGSIVMNQNTNAGKGAAQKRLAFFFRPCPANV